MNRRFLRSWLLLLLPLSLMAAPRSPPSPRSVSATNGVVSVECTLIGSKLSSITVRELTTGTGSKRQQWITYRDSDTYKNIVQRGKLYPLNSLMLHGIIYAKQAKNLDTDSSHDF
jgi:hypothetical protein